MINKLIDHIFLFKIVFSSAQKIKEYFIVLKAIEHYRFEF